MPDLTSFDFNDIYIYGFCKKCITYEKISIRNHSFIELRCKTCNDELLFVDDIILQTIVILNKKGYSTFTSCSGHVNDDQFNVYIAFDERIDVPYHPKPFKKSYNYGKYTIGFLKNRIGIKKRMQMIVQLNEILLDWAISLPDTSERC